MTAVEFLSFLEWPDLDDSVGHRGVRVERDQHREAEHHGRGDYPDLVNLFEAGRDRAPRPCTYCNKCLINFIENPLGCYEQSRFDSREEMIRQILSVYEGEPQAAEVA